MLNNNQFCHFGMYVDTCPYRTYGYNKSSCPLASYSGRYRTVPFTNNYWEMYTEPQYVGYVSNNNTRYFVDNFPPSSVLPIYEYASHSLAEIEKLKRDIEETRVFLESSLQQRRIEVMNSYVQRNAYLIPRQNYGPIFTSEQKKMIWNIASQLLSDYIKESVKATDTYQHSDAFSRQAQLFSIDVGKAVVDKIAEDIIDSNSPF